MDELHNRTAKYADMGIKFYVLFAPMKQEIYPEKLPVFYRRSPGGTLTDKIIASISERYFHQFYRLQTDTSRTKENPTGVL